MLQGDHVGIVASVALDGVDAGAGEGPHDADVVGLTIVIRVEEQDATQAGPCMESLVLLEPRNMVIHIIVFTTDGLEITRLMKHSADEHVTPFCAMHTKPSSVLGAIARPLMLSKLFLGDVDLALDPGSRVIP